MLVVWPLGRAAAEIADVAQNGVSLHEAAHIDAAPDKVFAALIHPATWWSGAHTFSHDAANLTLDPRAGGCWCETMPDGGSVEHLIVVYADPGKTLRLRGALGPFQGQGVDGAMTWSLKPDAAGTEVMLDYNIGGYMKGGFDGIAKGADAVLAAQVLRLKSFVETGSPEPSKPNPTQ